MSVEELAAPAAVDTAITYRCTPRLGHRCWQYDPTAKAIPAWVVDWINGSPGGRVEFCDRHGSTDIYFEPGDWLVVYGEAEDGQHADVFSPEDFATEFKLVLP